MKKIKVLSILLLVALMLLAFSGCAEDAPEEVVEDVDEEEEVEEAIDYPNQPIEMIITFTAGGAADISGRGFANAAEEHLGVPIGVQNITGAGGATGFDHVRRANPDGYEIGWYSASILTQTALGNLEYDYTEWEYVCRTSIDATGIVVRGDAPWEDLDAFVEEARDNPGRLTIGHAGAGSFTHLTAIAFAESADIDVRFIPSGVDRVPDLLAGEVDAISVHPPEILDLYLAEEVNLLAISAEDRVEAYEEVPLFGELGYEVDVLQMRGIFVPKGTPMEVIRVLEDAFRKAAEEEEVLDLARNRGFQVAFLGYEDVNEFMREQNELVNALVEIME